MKRWILALACGLLTGCFGTSDADEVDSSTSASGDEVGSTPAGCETTVISDGGFESGGGAWLQESLVYPSLVCDGSCDERASAYSGERFAWLGGTERGDQAALRQMVSVPPGNLEFTFYLKIDSRGGESSDTLEVNLGSRRLFAATNGDASLYRGYEQVTVSVFNATASSQELSFEATTSGESLTSFFIDSVALRRCSEGTAGTSVGGDTTTGRNTTSSSGDETSSTGSEESGTAGDVSSSGETGTGPSDETGTGTGREGSSSSGASGENSSSGGTG